MIDIAMFFAGILLGFVFGAVTVIYFWVNALEGRLAAISKILEKYK